MAPWLENLSAYGDWILLGVLVVVGIAVLAFINSRKTTDALQRNGLNPVPAKAKTNTPQTDSTKKEEKQQSVALELILQFLANTENGLGMTLEEVDSQIDIAERLKTAVKKGETAELTKADELLDFLKALKASLKPQSKKEEENHEDVEFKKAIAESLKSAELSEPADSFSEFTRHYVAADGNCFFYAVASQIYRIASHETQTLQEPARKLRERSLDEILRNLEAYRERIESEMNSEHLRRPEEYLWNYVKDKQWVYQLQIAALFKALRRDAVIVRPNGPMVIFRYDDKREPEKPVCLAFTGNHYDALTPTQEKVAEIEKNLRSMKDARETERHFPVPQAHSPQHNP